MKFQQPPAPNSPPKEANALELAIYNYEQRAHSFHSKRHTLAKKNETAEQREARIKEWNSIRRHLNNEKAKIKLLSKLEQKLELYRKEAWGKSRSERLAEKYHPTYTLARNLVASAEPKPSKSHQAHHIIPGKGRHDLMSFVRINLADCGIGVNDPFNGAWLPKIANHYMTPNATEHSKTFNWNYEQWVVKNLISQSVEPPRKNEFQTSLNNHSPFVYRLKWIKTQLISGKVPAKIGMNKDPNWDGK